MSLKLGISPTTKHKSLSSSLRPVQSSVRSTCIPLIILQKIHEARDLKHDGYISSFNAKRMHKYLEAILDEDVTVFAGIVGPSDQ